MEEKQIINQLENSKILKGYELLNDYKSRLETINKYL